GSLSVGEQHRLRFTPAPIGFQCCLPRRVSCCLVVGRFGPPPRFLLLGLRLAPGELRLGKHRAGSLERAVQVEGGNPARPIADGRQTALCCLPIGGHSPSIIQWEENEPAIPKIVRPTCTVNSRDVPPAVRVDENRGVLLDKLNKVSHVLRHPGLRSSATSATPNEDPLLHPLV